MIWCILLIIIIFYIIYNNIKEPLCVREDNISHNDNDTIKVAIGGEEDPCKSVANTQDPSECTGIVSNVAQCAYYNDEDTRLPEFTAELNAGESDLDLSDYICKRINQEGGDADEVDCSTLEHLNLVNSNDRDIPVINDGGDQYVPIPKDHLLFSSCALLNNVRSKSTNEDMGHGVSLLEEIGYGCSSGDAVTEEEIRDKKRNCSIYNWCLYELNDSNFFAMDGICRNYKLKNNNGVCERCEPLEVWSDNSNRCVSIAEHESIGEGCPSDQYLKRVSELEDGTIEDVSYNRVPEINPLSNEYGYKYECSSCDHHDDQCEPAPSLKGCGKKDIMPGVTGFTYTGFELSPAGTNYYTKDSCEICNEGATSNESFTKVSVDIGNGSKCIDVCPNNATQVIFSNDSNNPSYSDINPDDPLISNGLLLPYEKASEILYYGCKCGEGFKLTKPTSYTNTSPSYYECTPIPNPGVNISGVLDRYNSLNDGTVTTGNSCAVNEHVTSGHTCAPCSTGHHNDAGDNRLLLPTECDINICTCTNGVEATGTNCPTDNSPKCVSCVPGYHLDGDNCNINTYNCPNGTAVPDGTIGTHNDSKCSLCNPGYKLINDRCEPNVCTCQNGTRAMGPPNCLSEGRISCESCNTGYHVPPPNSPGANICIDNQCSCTNGTGETATNCPYNGSAKCHSCHRGYHLVGNTCVINTYTCDGGTALAPGDPHTGHIHPVNGEHICGSCDTTHYSNAMGDGRV